MKTLTNFVMGALLITPAMFGADKLKIEDLPPAVQKAVKEQTQNATLGAISKEVEKGKTMYEVESKVNGKVHDLMIDSNGGVISVEDEVSLDSIPGPAKDAILKKVGTGKIKLVEKVTQGKVVSYEASYTGKSGKSAEVGVNADGTPHK